MKITLEVALGLVLGWFAILGIGKYNDAHKSIEAPAAFSFDRNKIICDRPHTAFDQTGNTYCMDTSTAITGVRSDGQSPRR
jgi:hypothetical protein